MVIATVIHQPTTHTLNAKPSTLSSKPYTRIATVIHQPTTHTLNAKPSALNPKPAQRHLGEVLHLRYRPLPPRPGSDPLTMLHLNPKLLPPRPGSDP